MHKYALVNAIECFIVKLKNIKFYEVSTLGYKEFFLEKENRKYIKYENSSQIEEVFKFLCKKDSIAKMISASKNDRPALEGVIEDIEKNFPVGVDFDIKGDYFLRNALGSIVKYIISDFGYEVDIQKDIHKGSCFLQWQSATKCIAEM